MLRLKSMVGLGDPAAASATEKQVQAATSATAVPEGAHGVERKLVLTAGTYVDLLIFFLCVSYELVITTICLSGCFYFLVCFCFIIIVPFVLGRC